MPSRRPLCLALAALSLVACSTAATRDAADDTDSALEDRALEDQATLDAITQDAPASPDVAPSDASALDVPNDRTTAPLAIAPLAPWMLVEDREATRTIEVRGGSGVPRVFVEGLPPGALFDEATRTIRFRPDFIQGGQRFTIRVTARSGGSSATATLEAIVEDTIRPPAPTIARRETGTGFERLFLRQSTDRYTDSAGHAGRAFDAVVTVPTMASATRRMPVRVSLHGIGAASPGSAGSSTEFRIFPHDPNNTYWWGYSANLPSGAATSGTVPEYTARRVLQLVEWVQRTYAGADPDRTYIAGSSMGGAGAATIGLLHARHFCFVDASLLQTIPRNHRPSRMTTLTTRWGAPSLGLVDESGMSVWDRMDLTRALAESAEARDQFLEIHHGKDDDTIHFGAVVFRSPLTMRSFYQALQETHTGYLASWDEGSHGPSDPVLGADWWSNAFSFVTDATTHARRGEAFVAFSRCSADRNAGDGTGNGRRAFSAESGYAGQLAVAGDTGWSGEIAGTHNRLLRWDSTRITDTIDRFSIFVRAVNGTGSAPPRTGYPTRGDRFDGALPVRVDLTPRRVQRFVTRPGERVRWSFRGASGELTANGDGSVTVPAVMLDTTWTELVLQRVE
ncbi:MAG: hypothetical protein JNK05_28890 [Myxococcales bacterium]|nr:hypothetical protein [Myxococcales bacterium]